MIELFEEWFLSKPGTDKKALAKKNNSYVSDIVTGMFMAYVSGYERAKLNDKAE